MSQTSFFYLSRPIFTKKKAFVHIQCSLNRNYNSIKNILIDQKKSSSLQKQQYSTKWTQLTLEIEMSNLQICDPDVAASLCVCPLET